MVLEYLAWGPGNVASISSKFFPQPEEKVNDGNGKKPSGITRYTLKRLRKLESAGYIQMKQVDNLRRNLGSDSHIVVLQAMGAREVVLRFNYDPENIRQSLPNPPETFHDIMVASTIRKIMDESRNDLYKIEYLHTEHYVKKLHGRNGRGKGYFFPDCRARIVPHKGAALVVDLEVDAGSMGRSQLFTKIVSFKNATLIVCPNAARLKKIFHDLTDGQAKMPKNPLPAQLYLTLWNDFVKEGFRFGKVFDFHTGDLGVMPIVLR